MLRTDVPFELFYSSGGHGGPYPNADEAREAAKRLLRGRRTEHSIQIRYAHDFKTVLQTITREEAECRS